MTGEDKEKSEKASKDRRVHPIDSPRGSLRARLLKQMTATESSSKTAVSDLLFNLCKDEGTMDKGVALFLSRPPYVGGNSLSINI